MCCRLRTTVHSNLMQINPAFFQLFRAFQRALSVSWTVSSHYHTEQATQKRGKGLLSCTWYREHWCRGLCCCYRITRCKAERGMCVFLQRRDSVECWIQGCLFFLIVHSRLMKIQGVEWGKKPSC